MSMPAWAADRQPTHEGVPYKNLDPGIREVVRLFNEAGFKTDDSGDGQSKCEHGIVRAWPHVVAPLVPDADLREEARRAHSLLEYAGFKLDPRSTGSWVAEVVVGGDGSALLLIQGPRGPWACPRHGLEGGIVAGSPPEHRAGWDPRCGDCGSPVENIGEWGHGA